MVCAVSSVFASSCKEEGDEGGITPTEQKTIGTHKYDITPTNDYLVKNSSTDYVLVLPSVLSAELKVAKEEFLYLFKLATGINIEAISEEDATLTENSKYISIGETSLYESVAASDESKLVPYEKYSAGFKIFNKGKSIFLVGGNDYGSVYAVHEFMRLTFNYESYANNCLVIDENVKQKTLYNYDVEDIPDMKYYGVNYGVYEDAYTYDQRMFKYRMRAAVKYNEQCIPLYRPDDPNYTRSAAVATHTALTLVPIDYYNDQTKYPDHYHPNWFSTASKGTKDNSQLCFTARGDKAEYDQLVDAVAEGFILGLKRNKAEETPLKVILTVGSEDNGNHCTCAACKEVIEKYGARSTLNILLLNDVIPKVEAWMQKEENAAYKRDNIKYSFIAYEALEEAPTKYNAQTGKYETTNGLVLHEKLVPTICSMNNVDFQQAFYSDANKEKQLKIYDSWKDITGEILLYTYSTNFRNPSYMYDSFSFYTNEFYRYFAEMNVQMFYNESQSGTTGAMSTFHSLKLYIDSKLTWNCNLNIEELVDNFFNAMYKDAAPQMREIFYKHRMINHQAIDKGGFYTYRSVFYGVNNKKYYELASLLSLLQDYEKAYADIEKYKTTDLELYNDLHFHISQEFVSPAVMVLDLFMDDLKVEEARAILEHFKTVYTETKINRTHYTSGQNKRSTADWIAEKEQLINNR